MLPDVSFDPVPIALIIANTLATGTNRQQSAQGLDVRKRLFQVINELFPFGGALFICSDVQNLGDKIQRLLFGVSDQRNS